MKLWLAVIVCLGCAYGDPGPTNETVPKEQLAAPPPNCAFIYYYGETCYDLYQYECGGREVWIADCRYDTCPGCVPKNISAPPLE